MVCKVMAFNVISGLTEWAIKETWSLWSFPLPAVFTLFTPNTRRNLVLPLGNNMIPPSRFVTLCSALSLRFLRPLTVSYLHWMWQPSFMYLFSHSCSPMARLTHHMSCECCIIFTPYSSSGSILLPPTRLFFCCFVPPPPDAIAPRRMGDTVITDVIRRTLYSPRQQKTRSPMWLLPQG